MISMAVAAIATCSFAHTTNQTNPSAATEIAVQQDKVEVKPDELPEGVKATLAAAPYNEWNVEKAYLVPGENESNYFEISFSKGEEKATAKFDQEGKVIE